MFGKAQILKRDYDKQRKISFNVVSKEEEFKNKIETTIK